MTGVIIGVDPGKSGAIAFLLDDGHLFDVEDMPCLEGGLIDGGYLRTLTARLSSADSVGAWVERVHSMPKQGVASSFSFGSSFGGIVTGLGACGIGVELVTPNAWKKAAGLGKDKGAARAMACRLWPEQADLFRRVKDDGRAEAALIARYGWLLRHRDSAP